ncbi:MAG TPA: ubiquinol-cytochrome C chaperone family protein [Candidatus Pelagibacter bacterium]|jgi:cytochrome b pre-mRNA-processing protein 3|nr:ubiquinol-cytochrome C chaperone family protein [Candidatus Pelagibacter bacterium]|tara:strand:- start:62 stop:535 length:474 start_codon:yes stop_codon:yes gene_type:complete
MDNKYINFYNNLVDLTRNKILYKDFTDQDTFSDRLIVFLFHFAFFLNVFKSNSQKNIHQIVFDFIFNQLEASLREIGYGDTSINKKMKNYVNLFYSILTKIDDWENLDRERQKYIFKFYLNIKKESFILPEYFEKYRNYLKKNTFNSLLKGVIKPKF